MIIGTSLAEALGFRWEKHRRLNLGPHSNLKSLPSSVKDISHEKSRMRTISSWNFPVVEAPFGRRARGGEGPRNPFPAGGPGENGPRLLTRTQTDRQRNRRLSLRRKSVGPTRTKKVFGLDGVRTAFLAIGLISLSSCAAKPVLKQEAWIDIPGMVPDPGRAITLLVETLWREQKKFKPGKFRRVLPPLGRLAVGAVLNPQGQRTLLSQRLENLLARRLVRVSCLPVLPRNVMVKWEQDLAFKDTPDDLGIMSYTSRTSHRAATLGAADTVLDGRYRIAREKVILSAELKRLVPALRGGILTIARARVSMPLSALSLFEIIAQIPSRRRNVLPKAPQDWTWNPLSVWYEVIQAEGQRRKGLDGTILTAADSYLVSFLPAQPIYIMVLRLDSGGEAHVIFPKRGADLSERTEAGRRYAIPNRLSPSTSWASAHVLFSDEPFRYRRDIMPGIRDLLAQVRSGAARGPSGAGMSLPGGIFQKRLWFTQLK